MVIKLMLIHRYRWWCTLIIYAIYTFWNPIMHTWIWITYLIFFFNLYWLFWYIHLWNITPVKGIIYFDAKTNTIWAILTDFLKCIIGKIKKNNKLSKIFFHSTMQWESKQNILWKKFHKMDITINKCIYYIPEYLHEYW